jgi:hypothetical protein
MKTKYLLPHSLKLPGWIIFGIGIVLGLINLLYIHFVNLILNRPELINALELNQKDGWLISASDGEFWGEFAGLFLILGSLFIVLSKAKVEDEYIMKIRYKSLLWALIVNSMLMILAILSIYGITFYWVLMFSTVSLPILFLIKFKIALKCTSKTSKLYLFPNSLKKPGWIILSSGIALSIIIFLFQSKFELPAYMPAIYYQRFGVHNSGWFKIIYDKSILDEIAGLLLIVGALFVTLSKEKVEDEYIMKIRLESLLWALIANSILLIIAIFAFYGSDFFLVMNINIVSLLLLFLFKYKLVLKRGF